MAMHQWQVRIVFNAPLDREHPFTSLSVNSMEKARQIVADMRPAMVHAVSVKVQSTTNGGTTWKTLPSSFWGEP